MIIFMLFNVVPIPNLVPINIFSSQNQHPFISNSRQFLFVEKVDDISNKLKEYAVMKTYFELYFFIEPYRISQE